MFERTSNFGKRTAPPVVNEPRMLPPKRFTMERNAAVEAIINEAQNLGVAAVMLTSHANRLSGKTLRDDSKRMLSLIPKESAIIRSLENGMLDTRLSKKSIQLLINAYAEIIEGGDLIATYAHECETLGVSVASILHAKTLSIHWQDTCKLLAEALTPLMAEAKSDLQQIYYENWQALKPLLQGANLGRQSCVDDDGNVSQPDLPQRRHTPRVSLLQNCEVFYEDKSFKKLKSFKALARDISLVGLGIDILQQRPILENKTPVIVELSYGRELEGVIAWSDVSKLGITLNTKLDPNDPILFG